MKLLEHGRFVRIIPSYTLVKAQRVGWIYKSISLSINWCIFLANSPIFLTA